MEKIVKLLNKNNLTAKEKERILTCFKLITVKNSFTPGEFLSPYPHPKFFNSKVNISHVRSVLKKKCENQESVSLYIHIPFCYSKCHYCYFSSFQEKRDDEHGKYIDCLEKEIKLLKYSNKLKINSMYIGGGTPSILNIDNLKKLLKIIKTNFNLTSCKQFSIDIGPMPKNEFEKLKILKSFGFSRFTIGAQTFNKKSIIVCNRFAEYKPILNKHKINIINTFNYLKSLNLKYINIDLIAGLPGEKLEDFSKTIGLAKKIKPYFLNIYSYLPLPNSYFGKNNVYSNIQEREKMFKYAKKNLINKFYTSEDRGSNLSFNDNYYNNASILGVGFGARSYITCSQETKKGIRFCKAGLYEEYIDSLCNDKFPKINGVITKVKDDIISYLINHLYNDGYVIIKSFCKLFNKNFFDLYKNNLNLLNQFNLSSHNKEKFEVIQREPAIKMLVSKFFYENEAIGSYNLTFKKDILKNLDKEYEKICVQDQMFKL